MLTSTKQDIMDNKEKAIPLVVVLKALTHGVPVKIDGRELEMQNGKIFVAGRTMPANKINMEKWDEIWENAEKHYIGYSNYMPLDSLVIDIQNEIKKNPDFLEKLQVDTAGVIALNKL